MPAETTPAAVHDDERGRLVAVELSSLPFTAARCFVVRGPEQPVSRGGHVAGCREVIVLVEGTVRVRLSRHGSATLDRTLEVAGEHVAVEPDDVVDYDLLTPYATVVVLADRAFTETQRGPA